ncbi:MAG TPA: flagellin [Bdellovibrionota bacterium]
MGLRVATNVPSLTVQRNLQSSGQEIHRSLARLSSGQRIVNASDDAAGLSLSNNLEAEVRGLRQASRNANDGVSFVQTAEGGLNEVSNILMRLRELGVQAGSDTIGDEERSFLNREYQSLKQEVDRIAHVTNFNGRSLLNGSGDELKFQVGSHKTDHDAIAYRSDEANATSSSLGLGGAGVADKGDALDSLETVDNALKKVNGFRASLGALQNRLHTAVNNLGVHIENLSEAKSRIADTDIAEEASRLMRSTVVQNAGISVLAQANALPANTMKLL